MMMITCPYCGPRPETEFRWGGQAVTPRPGPHDQVSDEDWSAYLFHRDNPKGEMHEAWCHEAGCGAWFTLRRDTLTHAIETDPKA